jgi:hypothetical protein
MAVGLRPRRLSGAGIAGATHDVVDLERLSEPLAQFLGGEPRKRIGGAAGREWDDHAHRTRGIGLRKGGSRHSKAGGGGPYKLQESTARVLHGAFLIGRAASGHAAAAPPSSVMKSRRLMGSHLRPRAVRSHTVE